MEEERTFIFREGSIVKIKEKYRKSNKYNSKENLQDMEYGIIIQCLGGGVPNRPNFCIIPFDREGKIVLREYKGTKIPVRRNINLKYLEPFLNRSDADGFVNSYKKIEF